MKKIFTDEAEDNNPHTAYHKSLLDELHQFTCSFNVKGLKKEQREEIKETYHKIVNLIELRMARAKIDLKNNQ